MGQGVVKGTLDGVAWEVVLDWQEVSGRAVKPSQRATDQPGCFSFRFLQQICECDIGQDSCGPRPEGAAGVLPCRWANRAAGVSVGNQGLWAWDGSYFEELEPRQLSF